MIETFILTMVKEFGPTGILILGMFFLFDRHLTKITGHIEVMNHNSTKLLEKLDTLADRVCDKLDGKD